ncbi:MAG: hypothetical protein H7240_11030 [Glaciimonas sp.]|nr:hypothetical protein [Glaciimonas sp.]
MNVDLNTLRAKWLAPLIFFEFYLALTIFFFFFGPWPWNVDSPVLLGTYLVAAQVFIGLGYFSAWRKIRLKYDIDNTAVKNENIILGIVFLRRALIVTFILLIPTSLSRTGSVLPDIVAGLVDPGTVYNQNFQRLENGNAFVFVEYFRILFSHLLVGIYPLVIVYWSRLSRKVRFFSLFAISFNLSIYLATGTNKGLADFLITLPWLIYLGTSAGVLRLKIHRYIGIIGLVVSFITFMYLFGMGQVQREGGVGEQGIFNTGLDIITANTSNIAFEFLSNDLIIIYQSLTRYIGQGYYALSMSFDLDHSSTFGFGHSIFLARNADVFFDTNKFTTTSIPGLLEVKTGWGMLSLWHSIYPWLASDFGFIGALFVLATLSYLFSLSWGSALVSLAPRWIILSYLLIILFYYIPANNQIFQTGETFSAFFILLISIFLQKHLSFFSTSR